MRKAQPSSPGSRAGLRDHHALSSQVWGWPQFPLDTGSRIPEPTSWSWASRRSLTHHLGTMQSFQGNQEKPLCPEGHRLSLRPIIPMSGLRFQNPIKIKPSKTSKQKKPSPLSTPRKQKPTSQPCAEWWAKAPDWPGRDSVCSSLGAPHPETQVALSPVSLLCQTWLPADKPKPHDSLGLAWR